MADIEGQLPRGERIREGDIVVLYTGWDQYNWTKPTRNDVTYFDRHPGPRPEVVDELIARRIKWIGADLASIDHSLHTRVRLMRPDLVAEYEEMTGQPIEATLPVSDFEHVHYATARNDISMLENLGGEIAEVAGRRVDIGAFPWRWQGGEASVCRVAAFVED
jgi:kynurenine formamidase